MREQKKKKKKFAINISIVNTSFIPISATFPQTKATAHTHTHKKHRKFDENSQME